MRVTLHVWRQPGPGLAGVFVRYDMTDVSPDMSFLEMLDVLNQQLLARKDEPIAFDHDCREGICGRSEEHTSELQSRLHLVCRLLLEKKKKKTKKTNVKIKE